MLRLFQSLKLRSAPGPDGLPSWLFKHHGVWLTKPICHLFNLCLNNGHFPADLKRAIVVPIPKTSAPRSLGELRPISLTSNISKLLERAVLGRTRDKFKEVVNNNQFAYREKASTTCALVQMTHSWLHALDNAPNAALRVIAIDFSKAFDSIEHSLLVAKLHSYNFPPWAISIFRSFLCNREQCVRIGNVISQDMKITRGIPQGSVSGPLLFSLFINDLQPKSHLCRIIRFADDQTLTCPIDPAQLAQEEIEHIDEWCNENKMKLNLHKTKEMIVTLRPKDNLATPRLSLDGNYIEQVNQLSILGMTISKNLRWVNHLNCIGKKCRSDMFLVWRLKCMGLPLNDINQLIRCLLIPKLLYGYPAWCSMNKSELRHLNRLYRRVCKAGDASQFPALPKLLETHLLKLFTSAMAESHSLHSLIPTMTNTRYNMRVERIPLPHCRLTVLKNHFVFAGCMLYNNTL